MANSVESLNENFFYNSMLVRALLQISPAKDRSAFTMWLNRLHEMDATAEEMKIRNDYMWFMLLMLQSKRLIDPFKQPPLSGELKPLQQVLPPKAYEDILTSSDQNSMSWLEQAGCSMDLTDLDKMHEPYSAPPAKFLDNQPLPRDGIICYMAAFGDHDF